ncbi:hypothetical protein [Fischerella sp. PCC 9605]|uniref:hypothetical protein n=1 Tax=Fischerella sp. PCC 9605 TaxID=1173024 RepID=UPI000686CB14|nr:hypothetical protein [Fischerella sp. PCC 9605]
MTLAFASGCIGGLLNSLTVWFCGTIGLTALLGVKIAPELTPSWLYPRLVWGGLWGFIFLLPFFQNKYFYRGILYSLFPSLVQLFIIFPLKVNQGIMGVELGRLTPIVVLFFNFVWGASTALWLKFISGSSESKRQHVVT